MDKGFLLRLLSGVAKNPQDAVDKLARRYGSFVAIAEASPEEISAALDGDMTTSLYIKIAVATASRRKCDLFKLGKHHTDEEIAEYFKALFFGLSVETVYILTLDGADRVIACDKAGEGTVNNSNVIPRRLLEIAKRRGARSIIIAHNHPGGVATPSEEDTLATSYLRELFVSSGISVASHYIVAGSDCTKI